MDEGRGPWPYLFVLSPTKDVLHSGVANDPSRATVADHLKPIEGLRKQSSPDVLQSNQ